ncbi:MAG: DUF962 domain-containing protein [Polyangia bacterium]
METPTHFDSFEEFYPFYLSQHSDQTCRRLHFIGSSIGLVLGVSALVSRKPSRLLAGLAVGYGLAWVGHFFFEKNRPATFKFPLYSFMGDWVMWKDIATGKIPF